MNTLISISPIAEHATNSPQAKIQFLQTKIDEAIERARIHRRTNRSRATALKLGATLFSGAATVLLGLQIEGLEPQFRSAAFVLSALVTLFSALEPFFNFRALWIEHEIALWKFYRLRDRINFYLEGLDASQISSEAVDRFHTEYQAIWNDLSQSWINYRKQENS